MRERRERKREGESQEKEEKKPRPDLQWLTAKWPGRPSATGQEGGTGQGVLAQLVRGKGRRGWKVVLVGDGW